MTQVTRGERGWLAGFLDGEGSFFVRQRNKNKWRNEGYAYQISMANTDPRSIHKAANIVGRIVGHIVRVRTYAQRQRGYIIYQVVINGMYDLLAALDVVLPDLSGKHEEAQILRDHIVWRLTQWKGRRWGETGPNVVPPHVLAKDEEVSKRLRLLKRSFRVRTDYTEPSANHSDKI